MGTMTWQRGKYIKFYAKMKIRVGGTNPVDVQKGDEFEYDGSILKYSGMELSSPQLRGAIENGWATRESTEEELVESFRPSRNIAKSQTINKDLNNVQRISAKKITTSAVDENEILKVSDRGSSSNSNPKILRNTDNRKANMSIQSSTTDSQDAVSIGRVRTSARTVFNDVDKSDSIKKIHDLENLSGVRADLFQKRVEKEGVVITSNLGSVSSITEQDNDQGRVVSSVRKASKISSEGISVKDTSSVRSQKVGETKNEKIADPRIRIAKSIYPSFPINWSFTGKLSERLENVKKHGISPEFLEALYAAEGDQMRKMLVKEFPGQFGF